MAGPAVRGGFAIVQRRSRELWLESPINLGQFKAQSMGQQTSDEPPIENPASRSTAGIAADVVLVLVGLALIAGALSNIRVEVSGLVNLTLSAPGVLLVRFVFGTAGFALLLLGLAGLFDLRRQVAAAGETCTGVRLDRVQNPLSMWASRRHATRCSGVGVPSLRR